MAMRLPSLAPQIPVIPKLSASGEQPLTPSSLSSPAPPPLPISSVSDAAVRTVIDLTQDALLSPPAPPPSPPRSLSLPSGLDKSRTKRPRLSHGSPRFPGHKKARLREQSFLPRVGHAAREVVSDDELATDITTEPLILHSDPPRPIARSRLTLAPDRCLPRAKAAGHSHAHRFIIHQLRPQLPSPRPQNSAPEPKDRSGQKELGATPSSPQLSQSSSLIPRTTCRGRRRRRHYDTPSPDEIPSQPTTKANLWLRISQRPYLPAEQRRLIIEGAKHPISPVPGIADEHFVFHVDFTHDEVAQIFQHLSSYIPPGIPITIDSLTRLCYEVNIPSIVGDAVEGRSAEDVRNFCSDLMAGQDTAPDNSQTWTISRDVGNGRWKEIGYSRMQALLLARELEGNAGFGRMRRLENFQNEMHKIREDDLAVVVEYTNCAGDIAAMSWVPHGNILCGTTTHCDTHHQQYNRPGNLLLCSTTLGTLRAFADHRIPRPVVEKGDNSTEAMRRSQDPWLYTSVVFSDYDAIYGLAYSSGFDKTVKVWKVSEKGDSMEMLATWHHDGNVNFVVAARDGSGRVASAADVPSRAVRIYTVDGGNMNESPYEAISCTRTDADGSPHWAYYPATMQWGRAPGTTHLLLVGYSPRGIRSADDNDIPEDKAESGEIMLWDADRGCRVPFASAMTANVFEVAWHPWLARFVVASSRCGPSSEHPAPTQLHIFQQADAKDGGGYFHLQKLDCAASDINELTFMPNSMCHAYVTAGCTDGRVYVWDTAQGNRPMHVLQHGDPLDGVFHDREKEDTGVKFTAWGTSLDRFYSGSSDGVVKVWNVRRRRHPFVRNLLEAPGPISVGAFSPDHAQLAVGDATGRIFLLSMKASDADTSADSEAAAPASHPGPGTAHRPSGRRPAHPCKPLILHSEPPLPLSSSSSSSAASLSSPADVSDDATALGASRRFLDSGQIVIHRNPVVGAVQGPRYAASGLFRPEAHLYRQPDRSLLAAFARLQLESVHASRGVRPRRVVRRPGPRPSAADGERWRAQHQDNRRLDLDDVRCDSTAEAWIALVGDGGWVADVEEDWGYAYEEMPDMIGMDAEAG